MIEEQALVIRCDGTFAQVETQRSSSCGSCSAKSACGTAALAKVLGSRRSIVRVLNPIDARPGEQVVIGLEESALTRTSFVFYMVPLLALILGAILAQWIGGQWQFVNTEPFAIAGGLLGLLGGLLWVRRYAKSIRHDPQQQPIILRRSGEVEIHFKPHRV